MQKRFAEQQESNRLAIVEKILKEENEIQRKRKLYPEFYKKSIKPIDNDMNMSIKQDETLQTSQYVTRNMARDRMAHCSLFSNEFRSEMQSTGDVKPIVTTSHIDIDRIEYASSITSTYQHDELDEGKTYI
jgi:hypothetical protein